MGHWGQALTPAMIEFLHGRGVILGMKFVREVCVGDWALARHRLGSLFRRHSHSHWALHPLPHSILSSGFDLAGKLPSHPTLTT